MPLFSTIVLINETRAGLNVKLEQWRHILKYWGFRLSKAKAEYLKCEFSGVEESNEEFTMDDVTIPRGENFRYLGSIIE